MADEHPNVQLVREGFDAFERGDAQWMADHMSDDVVWHIGGKSKLAGEYRGKDKVLELFAKQGEMFGTAQDVDIHDIMGNERHVMVIGRATVPDPDGGEVSWLYANVFHVANGMVTEVWGLADETSESDALIDKLMG